MEGMSVHTKVMAVISHLLHTSPSPLSPPPCPFCCFFARIAKVTLPHINRRSAISSMLSAGSGRHWG